MSENSNLITAISKECNTNYIDSSLLALEITTTYSEEITQIAVEWAKTGKIPDQKIDELEIKEVHRILAGDFLKTLRLLNIYIHNQQVGMFILNSYKKYLIF